MGSHIGDDEVAGYYIDFTVKADTPEWPPAWLDGDGDQLHVATAQFGLGCIERHLDGDDGPWLEVAIATAEHLLGLQAPDGAWPHQMPMPHSYWLRPPWLSGMAQGEGASLLVRVHALTGDERFAEGAIAALAPMQIPSADGGVRAELGGGFFPEEYPTDPSSYVLNGGIFALWGCRDVAVGLGDDGARALYEEGVDTLAANIHRYDTGYWSLYDLFPHPARNVASGAYHQLHLTQLRALELVSPRPQFASTIERWQRYQGSRAARTRAMAEKIAFRVAVPRNANLAHRLPWSHRPDTGEVLVMCYHAVSDEWPSRLAVTTNELRRQLTELVDRGYRGVTFLEAATGEADGKRLAVTFDDGYATLLTKALPILSELGLTGTVFMPTGFPGGGEPMSWKGIEQWLGTEYEPELLPLDWEALRALQDAGWEIGSHTVTHPKLTEIADERLRSELVDSRAELERHLGRPCRTIAYPYGDVDERVIAAARDAGYFAGAALPSKFESSPRLLCWPRVGIYRADRGLVFEAKISRAIRWLRRSPAWSALNVVSRARGRATAGAHQSNS